MVWVMAEANEPWVSMDLVQDSVLSRLPETMRFFVAERKPMGRESMRIIEIRKEIPSARILRGRTGELMHEIDLSNFEQCADADNTTVSAFLCGNTIRLAFNSRFHRDNFMDIINSLNSCVVSPKPVAPSERFEVLDLLEGETISVKFSKVGVSCIQRPIVHFGYLMITNARMFITTCDECDYVEGFNSVSISVISFLSISEIELNSDQQVLQISVKDGREVLLHLDEVNSECHKGILKCISDLAFPATFHECFALAHFSQLRLAENLFDDSQPYSLTFRPSIENEFKRLRLNDAVRGWRLSHINESYDLCPSYPHVLAVPASVSDHDLAAAALFRGQNRLPVVCWANAKNVSILRSSQPRSGITGQRSSYDEAVINEARCNNRTCHRLVIFDLRSKINVLGNQFKGKGSENPQNYQQSSIVFMGLKNLHAVRDSYNAVVNMHRDPADNRWFFKLDASKWFHHIETLLRTSFRVAYSIDHDRCSVLVHCSDGWDRTCQVASIAQLLLDPYYRTLIGFMTLLQKEWIEFGHRFSTRHAGVMHSQRHYSKSKVDSSPIFMLFLDAVHQLLKQQPNCFEFNCPMLEFLAFQSYEGRFGNFLCDSPKEIMKSGLGTTTLSIWYYIERHKAEFLESSFVPNDAPIYNLFNIVIRKLSIWEGVFSRWDP